MASRLTQPLDLGLTALLAALSMVSPFTIDTFFPSFKAIASEFSLEDWQIQQTLTAYLLPYAVVSLIQGPLSDALGRRPIIIAGLAIYTVASVACALAPSFETLLAFRMVQGMSAGVGFTVGRAIVRDLYEGPQAQRLMSAIMMIFGLAPALAPIVGGWIHVAMGWRGVFAFMVLLGLALLLASYQRLPETHPVEHRSPFHPGQLMRTALSIAGNREFLLLALAAATAFGAVALYIGSAPAIVFDHWHLSETQFGWLFAPLVGGLMAGAWISGRVAGRISPRRQVVIGYGVSLVGAGLQVALHLTVDEPPVWLQQLLLAILAMSVQIVQPVLALRMLDLFPKTRGSAASVQSCVHLAGMALMLGAIAPALNASLLTLAAGSFASALVAMACWGTAVVVHRAHGH